MNVSYFELLKELDLYVKSNYVPKTKPTKIICSYGSVESLDGLEYDGYIVGNILVASSKVHKGNKNQSLEDYINEYKKDSTTFYLSLCKILEDKNIDEIDFYKKLNISRQSWSKYKSGANPKKEIVVKMCLYLDLNFKQCLELLTLSDHALSRSNKKDLIAYYAFEKGKSYFEYEYLYYNAKL